MKQLDGLLEFCKVAENEGFTRAAEAMGLSTSYISRRVADLEARLGVRLLNRSTRRVNLTDLGRQYYERAQAILSDIEALETDLADQQKLVKGAIRITAGGQFGESFVARKLAEFAVLYPEIKIHLDISNRHIDLIEERFDLAIRHGIGDNQNLIAKKLGQRRIMVCGSPTVINRHGVPEQPEDLTGMECITSNSADWTFQRNGSPFTVHLTGRWCSNNGAATVQAAKYHIGFIRAAENYLKDDLKNGTLIPVLEDYELPPEEIFVLYPSRDRLPYRVRTLIDFLSS